MKLYQGLHYISKGLHYISSYLLVARIIECLVGNLPLLYPCLYGAAPGTALSHR
jgi:hypothetical protein